MIGARVTECKRDRYPTAREDGQRKESDDPALSVKAGAISLAT